MEALFSLLYGFGIALQPINLLYAFLGCLLGTLVGVLPGIGPSATIALLLPTTYYIPPVSGIIMLAGICYGAMYGGSTTSILINTPGEPASVVTCLDGYKMARQGRAGPALGIAAFGSFIAGTLSVVGLMFLAPLLSDLAIKFGPPEYFSLMVLAFCVVTYLAQGSMAKAWIMVGLGLIMGTVGMDPITSRGRFTYNILAFNDGLGLAVVMIGLFGVSEVLLNIGVTLRQEVFERNIKGIFPNRKDWRDSILPITRGSLLGFFLGVLPGVGPILPTFASYVLEKKLSKYPQKFGTGVIEGVAAPEAANNAAVVGTFIPMLSLGVPSSAMTALLLGALMIYGLQPGPLLVRNSPDVFWGLVASMYIANVMLLVLNLPLIWLWVKFLAISYSMLFSLILLFCLIGAYSINNNIVDIYVMIGSGVLGYLLRKFGYDPVPLVLAFVLGPIFEVALRRSLIISQGNFSIFLSRPISLGFLIAALIIVFLPLVMKGKSFSDRLLVKQAEV
ncbi:MAG: tripartite tricarboxylate transporter permease [Deltaproteobacteria bacterium]|nr:tripartite tricarboxylate transporter permease [Deltaproteobacteria bacterium]